MSIIQEISIREEFECNARISFSDGCNGGVNVLRNICFTHGLKEVLNHGCSNVHKHIRRGGFEISWQLRIILHLRHSSSMVFLYSFVSFYSSYILIIETIPFPITLWLDINIVMPSTRSTAVGKNRVEGVFITTRGILLINE